MGDDRETGDARTAVAGIAERYGPVAANEAAAADPRHLPELTRFAELLPILDDATLVTVAADAIVASARAAATTGYQHVHAKVSMVHAEAVRRHVAAGHTETCGQVRLFTLAYGTAVRQGGLDPAPPPVPPCTCGTTAPAADRRQAPRSLPRLATPPIAS